MSKLVDDALFPKFVAVAGPREHFTDAFDTMVEALSEDQPKSRT